VEDAALHGAGASSARHDGALVGAVGGSLSVVGAGVAAQELAPLIRYAGYLSVGRECTLAVAWLKGATRPSACPANSSSRNQF